VQRDFIVDARGVIVVPTPVLLDQRRLRRARGQQRRMTRAFGVSLDRKDRQHGIANELQDLAAIGGDRIAHRPEIAVEQIDQRVLRQRFRQAGKPAQVAEPDHRGDGLAGTAPDLSLEHAATGLLSDIGIPVVIRETSTQPQAIRLRTLRESREHRRACAHRSSASE
jgi:hypothetical protein